MNTFTVRFAYRLFSIILAAILLAALTLGAVPAEPVPTARSAGAAWAAPARPSNPAAGVDQIIYLPLISKSAAPGAPVRGVIPPSGASLTAVSFDGAVLTLQFPVGAVTDPLTVTLTPTSAPADAWADFEISPAGYLFQANVTLTLLAPLTVTLTSSAALYYNLAGQPVYLPAAVDLAGRRLTASLTSLGLPAVSASSQPGSQDQAAADNSTELIASAQSQVAARIAAAQAELTALLANNDFAHALPLQMSIIALLHSFGGSDAEVLAWVNSAGATACQAYGQAATHATATPVTDFGQFYGLVSPLLQWEAITQQLGVSPCAAQPHYQTVLTAKMTELHQVIQAKLPILPPPESSSPAGNTAHAAASYDQDFADAQPEVQDLTDLGRQSYAMLLTTTSTNIDTGVQNPLLEQVRSSAYSQCYSSDYTPLQKYLGQYLATVKADLSGGERSILVDALQKDIQYCGSGLYYRGKDGYTVIFGNWDGDPLGGGADPGSQMVSADERTPVKRNLDLQGWVLPLQCPDGSVEADQVSIIFNGYQVWTGSTSSFNDHDVIYYLKNLVQQAGGDPAAAAGGVLQVKRTSLACGGAYGPSPFTLFTLNFTFGPCVPPAGASYCAEEILSDAPWRVLPDDGKVYIQPDRTNDIVKWDDGVFTTLGTLAQNEDVIDVNDLGHVLVEHRLPTSPNIDHLWVLRDGARQEIQLPDPLRGLRSDILINNSDQVVFDDQVEYFDNFGRPYYIEHVYMWQNGVTSDLGEPGGGQNTDYPRNGAWVWGMNNAGQIVGHAYFMVSSNPPDWEDYAFLWSGGWTRIGSNFTNAWAINDAGHVLVQVKTSNTAALWSSSGVINLQPPAGCSFNTPGSNLSYLSYPRQLNNSDVIVSFMVCDSSSPSSIFIWHNGQAVGLDSLVKLPEGVKLNNAWSPIINQAGIIRVIGRVGISQLWPIYLLYPAGQ
jgi:uncharacterized membrane protein